MFKVKDTGVKVKGHMSQGQLRVLDIGRCQRQVASFSLTVRSNANLFYTHDV